MNEQFALLHAALDRLAPMQQRVMLLRYYGQMDFQEIADTLEMPLGAGLEPLSTRAGNVRTVACRGLVMNDSSREDIQRLQQMLEEVTAADIKVAGQADRPVMPIQGRVMPRPPPCAKRGWPSGS